MTFDPKEERGFAVVEAWERPSVAIYGMGYIGLPTALAFAGAGKKVLGVDVNPEVVHSISNGRSHIVEDGIPERLIKAIQSGLLQVSVTPGPADAHLVAVPTPATEDRRADLSYVEAAARALAGVLQKGDLVVIESTIPPGTCERVVGPIIESVSGLRYGQDYDLAHCPERVIPGRIFIEIVENDRIIGGTTRQAAERAAALYRTFVTGDLLLSDAITAELSKLMENTFRDVNIALANEFSEICESLGANVFDAIALANRHPRVDILQPGIGVGGHCIPVDPWFLVESAPESANLIRAAREVNLNRTERIAERIVEALWQSKSRCVAFLGLAYKADVDDFRESPAVDVVRSVRERWQGQILVTDPFGTTAPPPLRLSGIEWRSQSDAIREADTIVPLVGHSEYAGIDADSLAGKAVVDPAGIWRSRSESERARARAKA